MPILAAAFNKRIAIEFAERLTAPPLDRPWSDQQLAIFEWFDDPIGNLVVRARAGTGKTATCIEGIRRSPIGEPEAKTLHSVGFAAVRRCWSVQVAQRTERQDALTARVTSGSTPDYIRQLVSKLHTLAR